MFKIVSVLLVLVVLAGAAGAQVYFYDFTYDPLGTTLNSVWKEDKGDWAVTSLNGQNWLQSQPTSAWQYATAPAQQYLNCCVQCEVRHPGPNLVFGGVTLRCLNPNGSSSGQDLLMAKMQGSSGLNGMWLYTYSPTGAAVTKSTVYTSTQQGTIRLLVDGNNAIAQVDANGDDVWDAQVNVTTTWTPQIGPVGFCGYNGALMDKFRLWDGVIMDDPTSPAPTPGAIVKFQLAGASGLPYLAATALSNKGFLLPGQRKLPLSPDGLFSLSVTNVLPATFRNYGGVMDNQGHATISLAIPKIAALKGIMLYTAFVNYRSPYIYNVSHDHRVQIQ